MKKIVAILCTAIMLPGIMAGCSSGSNNESSANNKAAESANAKGNSEAPIRIVRPKSPQNLPAKDMIWYKNYTKVSGIDIDWQEIPQESSSEKINLMLSTGDLPEAFMQSLNTSMIMKNVDQGIFLPIEDYIKDMPNFSKVLEKRPEYKSLITAPDGHIYGLPYIEEMFGLISNQGILHIYKPWLDKLGLPIPKTIDEYRDTLKKFVESDMNGNGKKDEIGLALANKDVTSGIGHWRNANDFGQFFGLWGQADRNDSLGVDENGKVFSTSTTEAYKTGIKYLHDMYKDGLIDEEYLITDSPKLQAKLRNPDVIVGSVLTFSISDMVDKERAKDYVAVPYLTGPGGEFGTRENLVEMHNPVAFVLTKAAKNPERILKWADGLYDPSWSVQTNWGPLGYQYKKNDAGVMVFDDLKDGLKTYSEMRSRNTIGGGSPVAVLTDYYDTVVEYPQDAKRLLDDMKAVGFIDKHLNDPYIPHTIFYEPEVADKMALLSAQVYQLMDNNRRKWITDGGIDQEWDKYLKDLDKAGWYELIGYVQEAYTRYLKNQ
ncbi:extracellular solute-binding protein [Paenibacillus glycanilyticus]|uniref:extracellular solute-binding protein n=1 Tax=Paenibacillus glycanilyticus TaxID=126569 RepID=UPI000FDA6556|nr:extracellular solute-binding protein [Paenibacillus glycanilyticus]